VALLKEICATGAAGLGKARAGVAAPNGYSASDLQRHRPRRTVHARDDHAALEDAARAQGLALIRLETGQASPEAIRLYARLGYREIGPFGAYRDNGSSIFMEKAL